MSRRGDSYIQKRGDPFRPSFFSGLLYPSDPEELKSLLLSLLDPAVPRKKVKAITIPHGSLAFIGKKMAKLYASIEIPKNVILIGQNHTERGEKFAIYSKGAWQTPLGETKVNEELASLLMDHGPKLRHDELAFFQDPTLEVQLPFIQLLSAKTQIVPITVMPTPPEYCQSLGQGLAKTIEQYQEPILMIVSSNNEDLTSFFGT